VRHLLSRWSRYNGFQAWSSIVPGGWLPSLRLNGAAGLVSGCLLYFESSFEMHYIL
jgi:hypothetical protein